LRLLFQPREPQDYYGFDYKAPAQLKSFSIDPQTLRRTGDLEWENTDGIKLKPLYNTHRQRYVVY